LKTIFDGLDASPKGKRCVAMEGLIEERKEVIDESGEPAVVDATLIVCA
jgi:ferritin-like metal-binding protein YciE